MTEREKVAHVLRRFGLGAGKFEVDQYEKLGVKGTIDRLLNFEKVDEQFDISPWSVAMQSDGQLYRDAYQMGTWWALRMLMTERPLQEKLALFWHDHFAVSGDKVFEGPTMLRYTEILREKGIGKFRDLLTAVSKHGALVGYLDANTSTKIHPNENFAREMFELFTMGVGNYTEQDVKEAARAFTGWSLHYAGLGDETPYEKQADLAARKGMSMLNFCDVPEFHDDGEKAILGKKGRWTGQDVLDLLADRPETGRFICKKLWEFFGYANPEPQVLEALANTWKTTGGDIRSILRVMTERPEFWSDKCVRTLPKCPVDYTVAMFRAIGVRPILRSFRKTGVNEYEPVKEDLRKIAQGAYYLMAQQGMTLLFPPNVGGWEWGGSWITANNSVLRVNHAVMLFWGEDKNRPVAVLMAEHLKTIGKTNTASEIVDAVADVFDASLTSQDRDVLIEVCSKAGAASALNEKDQAANLFANLTKIMFASPSFQLC